MKIIDKTDQARKRSFLWSPKFFTAQAVTMICHVQNDNRTLKGHAYITKLVILA